MDNKRRNIIRNLALAPLLLGLPTRIASGPAATNAVKTRIQYSLNAYSFNTALRSGKMTFFDMMEYAASIGLDAVDLTAYYFSSYPDIPENSALFAYKHKALELGLDIPWTGVRNNFVDPDADARAADRNHIREWLAVSSKLGATIMRVFTGRHQHEGYTRTQVMDWLVDEYKSCAQYGEQYGVIIGLQNHHEFLFHSKEIIEVIERVDSKWFGLVLDVGSLHAEDPYSEIEQLAPYANYWFIKEHVFPGGERTPVEMKKIAAILSNQGYKKVITKTNDYHDPTDY